MEDKARSHEKTVVLLCCRSGVGSRSGKFNSVEYKIESDPPGAGNERRSLCELGLEWGSLCIKEAGKNEE